MLPWQPVIYIYIYSYSAEKSLLLVTECVFTMDTAAIINELKNYPSLDRVDELLDSCLNDSLRTVHGPPNSSTLELYSTLINHTLPSLESHLKGRTFDILLDLFTSLPGISSVVARIQSLVSSVTINEGGPSKEYTANIKVYSHINLLCEFLQKILLDRNVLKQVWDRLLAAAKLKEYKLHLYKREITALFSGSRVFSCFTSAWFVLSKYDHKLSMAELQRYNTWEDFSKGKKYVKYLASEILQLSKSIDSTDKTAVSELFEKAIKLGHPMELAAVVMSRGNIGETVNIYKGLRQSEKQNFITNVCLKYFQQTVLGYHTVMATPEIVSAMSAVVGEFVSGETDHSLYSHLFAFGEENSNLDIRRVVVLICATYSMENLKLLFQGLVNRWGDSLAMKRYPLELQEAQTELLFLTIPHLPVSFLRKVSSSSYYLNAISNRLGSTSSKPRLYGTLFAERLSSAAPDPNVNPLNFGLKGLYDDEQTHWKNVIAQISDKAMDLNAPEKWDVLFDFQNTYYQKTSEPITYATIPEHNTSSQRTHQGPDLPSNGTRKSARITKIDSDDEDEALEAYPFPEDDAEDSDDDPTLAKKEKVQPPVYIKDLLSYLSEDEYEKQKLAIENAEHLIVQKAKFGEELEFYSKELASSLVSLKDTYEIENYNEKKLNAIKSLVAACPTIVPQYMAVLLFEGDYSLQQRLTILSGITLGAKKLSDGYDYEPSVFPGKQLPPELDKAFRTEPLVSVNGKEPAGPKVAIDNLSKELQRGLLKETTDKAEDSIGGPKVLRVSRKLQKEREFGKPISIYNPYSKVASKYFLFPLTAQWHRSNGIRELGSYSEILKSHFLKTLALLLHAAYPSSQDLPDMTTELLEIVLSQRASSEPIVQEGLLTIILVVLQIHDGELLVSKWPRQIVELKNWLEDTWEYIGDENVRGMAAGVLYQLAEVMNKYQRRLIGQISGLENRIEDIKIQ